MKVAILGSRGIPARYSGFETSIQETAIRFVKAGVRTVVYCRRNHYVKRVSHFLGVELVYCRSVKSKYLDTITHTFFSFLHSVRLADLDVVVMYGVGNAVFIPLYRMFSIPVIAVLDGADWERKKWGPFARWFLRSSRHLAVHFATYYVVDNELLCQQYKRLLHKDPIYIPYGAAIPDSFFDDVLRRFQLQKHKYVIFVGRFVQEKGIDFLIRNFEKVESDIRLVIVGGTPDKAYEEYLKSTEDQRILFTGLLYGADYESLLKNALFYVSCSLLEGTSPSLLSAMAINGFALVSDLEENKEVLKGTCATFKVGNGEDFIAKFSHYVRDPVALQSERARTRDVVIRHYDWDVIAKQYLGLFLRSRDNNSRVR